MAFPRSCENHMWPMPRRECPSCKSSIQTITPKSLLRKSEGSVFSGRKMAKSVKESGMALATRSWVAKPILGTEFTEDPPLQDFYVGLKRCTGNKLLLASPDASKLHSEPPEKDSESRPLKFLSEDKLKAHLLLKGFDLSLLEDKFELVKVPGCPARTKAQAARASKVWPVNFHPDPFIESLIDGSIFDEDQLRMIENYMVTAIEATKLAAVGNNECNGSALIVDPQDGRILTVAASKIDKHPLWHAAMLAIDLVAKLQGGGAWNLENIDENPWYRCEEGDSSKNVETPEVIPDRVLSQEVSPEGTSGNRESRAECIKRKYEEEAPFFYPRSLSTLKLPKPESLEPKTKKRGRRNNGIATTNADTKKCETVDTEKIGPYLCTGYTVFLVREPCPMCAMALLHSRVGRIFYGVANRNTGILGSNGILHAVPGLNHRFRVWSGILEQECQEALKEIEDRHS